jgi:drug/metabolite transporter (DMT)-like permease
MDWFYPAVAAAILASLSAVLEKPLVGHMFPTARAFIVSFGALKILTAGVLLAISLMATGFDGGSGIPWALGSGFVWVVGIILFFYALSTEEVSRVAPMMAIAPLFTASFAVLLLGEPMALAQWAGMLGVVVGAILLNLGLHDGGLRFTRKRPFVALLTAAALLGASFIVADQAVSRMNVLATQALRDLTLGAGVLAVAWRPRYTAQVMTALRDRRTLGLFLLAVGLLTPLSLLTFVYALAVGPVARVGAVFGSWPLGVLVLSLALSTPLWNVLGEQLDRNTIALKAIATILVVGGVVAVRL